MKKNLNITNDELMKLDYKYTHILKKFTNENGKIIQTDSGVFPAPEHIGIRDRLLDIRGVDIRLTFASKDDFFQKAATTDNPRVVLGLAGGNRNNTIADGLDRKLRDSVIVTVHTRNIGETF